MQFILGKESERLRKIEEEKWAKEEAERLNEEMVLMSPLFLVFILGIRKMMWKIGIKTPKEKVIFLRKK